MQPVSDLVAILIGVVCGIAAGIPTTALMLIVLAQRDARKARRLPASRAEAAPEQAPQLDRQQLEQAADRLEMIFISHGLHAQVRGGMVTDGAVVFNLVTPWGVNHRQVLPLLCEVSESLHAKSCQIGGLACGQLQLEVRGMQ